MTDSILFIGDIHIKLHNIDSIDKLQNKIESLTDIDAIVIGGDILDSHERLHTQLLNRAYLLIETCSKIAPTFVIVGNHDYINNQQFLTTNHWMNALKKWNNVTIVDKPVCFKCKTEQEYVCVPYVYPGRLIEALNTLSVDWKTSRAIFAHQEIYGCKMGALTSSVGDVWPEQYPLLISGHIHDRQHIGTNVIYPGSSINNSFSSDSQGIYIYNFSLFSFNEELVELNLLKKHILQANLDSVSNVIQKLKLKDNKTNTLHTSTHMCNFKDTLINIKTFKQSKEYSNLSKYIRIKFTVVPIKCEPVQNLDQTQLRSPDNKPIEQCTPFWKILDKLIQDCKDPYIEEDYLRLRRKSN